MTRHISYSALLAQTGPALGLLGYFPREIRDRIYAHFITPSHETKRLNSYHDFDLGDWNYPLTPHLLNHSIRDEFIRVAIEQFGPITIRLQKPQRQSQILEFRFPSGVWLKHTRRVVVKEQYFDRGTMKFVSTLEVIRTAVERRQDLKSISIILYDLHTAGKKRMMETAYQLRKMLRFNNGVSISGVPPELRIHDKSNDYSLLIDLNTAVMKGEVLNFRPEENSSDVQIQERGNDPNGTS